MNDAHSAFIGDFHAHFTRDSNACVFKGVDRGHDRLPDPSLAAAAEDVADARKLLERLSTLPREGLDLDARIDLDLARLMLEQQVHDLTYTFNEQLKLEQLPHAGADIGDPIFLLFANDPRPAVERLGPITARLEQVPAFLDAMLARLRRPVARWVDIDLAKVAGMPSLFQSLLGWAEAEHFADTPRLAAAIEGANAALAAYATKLKALPTVSGVVVGEENARKIVALRGIELSFEELHGIARAFLAESAELLETLGARLVVRHGLEANTDVATLHTYLNQKFRVKLPGDDLDAIVDRYALERGKLLAFLQERDLFPIFEAQDLRILRTPRFMEPSIPAGAMVAPPPFREGIRTSLVYLTVSPELLDEHTELGIPLMMLHEGIPGHHLQLATAGTHASVIRRHVDAMEQAEGWTTMLEDYILDLGYMGDLTDEARFCARRELSRVGARVAIDLFFMTGERKYLDVGVDCDTRAEDPFVAAGNLLQEVTGFAPARIGAELNWYSQERGYPLCYLTGNRLVWQLKRDMAKKLGGEGVSADDEWTADRRFHAEFLKAGSMPVAYMRRAFEGMGLV